MKLKLVSLVLLFVSCPGLLFAGHWDLQPSPIQVIEQAGYEVNVDSVIGVINDGRDPKLRQVAVWALAQLHNTQPSSKDGDGFAAIVRATSDADSLVRVAAFQALGYFRSVESVGVFRNSIDTASDPTVRASIAAGLDLLHMPEAVDSLSAIANKREWESRTRVSALYSLEKVASKADLLALQPLLSDSDPNVRARAALVVSRKTANASLEQLIAIATDDSVNDSNNEDLVRHIESLVNQKITDDPGVVSRGYRKQQLQSWWVQNQSSVSEIRPPREDQPND